MEDTKEFYTVKEGQAEILFPKSESVFYNPVQEFNRDLTIAVINEFIKEQEVKDLETNNNKDNLVPENVVESKTLVKEQLQKGVTILEALSATGLRSIRFAKELPYVKKIIANDLSKQAFENIKRNIENNKVSDVVTANLEDATMLMYRSRSFNQQFDVVDIDPYGSASIFIDSAVQAVKSGGLLCVTCTDMAVLAGNHPEACWSKYNCIPLKTKACHEQALRILLYSLSSAASRYGRYIVPLISVSVDFYIRIFVKVFNGQKQANLSASKQIKLWRCCGCASFTFHSIATEITKGSAKTLLPQVVPLQSQMCPICDHRIKIAGPYWGAPIHDMEFTNKVLSSVKKFSSKFGTSERIIGILSMITEELVDVPFYYISDELSSILRCDAPPVNMLRSAIMNSGFRVSLFHGKERSIKTDAPAQLIWDIMKKWLDFENNESLKKRVDKMDEKPAKHIFSKPIVSENIDLTIRDDCISQTSKLKIKRFPMMPSNWGPKSRATYNSDGLMKISSNEKSKKFQGKRKLAKRLNQIKKIKSEETMSIENEN